MAITKDHGYVAAIGALAIGLGVQVARGGPAVPEPEGMAQQSATKHDVMAHPMSGPCADACKALGDWCPNGHVPNCAMALASEEGRGTVNPETGAPYRCSDALGPKMLATLGWCGDGGADVPLGR